MGNILENNATCNFYATEFAHFLYLFLKTFNKNFGKKQ